MGNICMVGRKRTFKWRIEGFSSLSEIKEKELSSQSFKFGGYTWSIRIKKINCSKKMKRIVLYLELKDAASLPSNLVVKAVFTLIVYDQLRSCHQKFEAECYFGNEVENHGSDIILLESCKHKTCGLLVNGSCNFGVKFSEVRAQKLDCRRMFECLSVQKMPKSYSYTWRIENFSELQRPKTVSSNFVAGGHKWNLKLYPDGKKSSYLGIFLELHTTSTLPLKSALYAKFTLCLLDQINGHHKKITGKSRFSDKAPTSGHDEFIYLDDFKDQSNGFLIENSCIIEASVQVIGLSIYP